MSKNIIAEKSFDFSILIVRTYKEIVSREKEYVLSKQILRSGTSIGANVSEAIHGQSGKDFISKMSIARKEARETLYWLRILEETEFISRSNSKNLKTKCEEILRILTSIILTMEQKVTKH